MRRARSSSPADDPLDEAAWQKRAAEPDFNALLSNVNKINDNLMAQLHHHRAALGEIRTRSGHETETGPISDGYDHNPETCRKCIAIRTLSTDGPFPEIPGIPELQAKLSDVNELNDNLRGKVICLERDVKKLSGLICILRGALSTIETVSSHEIPTGPIHGGVQHDTETCRKCTAGAALNSTL